MPFSLTLPFGWSQSKFLLVCFNILAGVALIAISHTSALPLSDGDFFFFSFVGFLCALYRPGWVFLLLIGMLPYEIITIAPVSFGIAVRPYQWLLVLVTLALLVRLALKRFPLQKFVPNLWDMTLIIFTASAWLSALASGEQAGTMKLCVILSSFILLYFVTRIFVRSLDDARMLLPFFFSSFLVIAVYAILQNIFFMSGKESFEVMVGRPNATFAEADWLGGYLAVMITLLVGLIVSPALLSKYASLRQSRLLLAVLLFFGFSALIITVSRSAWLAAFFGSVVALVLFGWQRGVFDALYWRNMELLKKAFFVKLFILIPFFLALFAVYIFHLSPFDLSDRSRSVASGEQKITVACDRAIALPEKIASLQELANYGCRHIRLEDIEVERSLGHSVTEVLRADPNIEIRQNIYAKTIFLLKEHPFAGIGFGTVSQYLGTDERGAGLNASNIFLEVWLGSGLIGFLAFVFFWFGLGLRWLLEAYQKNSSLALILAAVFVSVTLFNLFNSGLFLAWFFIYLAFLALPSHNISHE